MICTTCERILTILCFTSDNYVMLIEMFKYYVCPLLMCEFGNGSGVFSLHTKKVMKFC